MAALLTGIKIAFKAVTNINDGLIASLQSHIARDNNAIRPKPAPEIVVKKITDLAGCMRESFR